MHPQSFFQNLSCFPFPIHHSPPLFPLYLFNLHLLFKVSLLALIMSVAADNLKVQFLYSKLQQIGLCVETNSPLDAGKCFNTIYPGGGSNVSKF